MWAIPRRRVSISKGICKDIFALALKNKLIKGRYVREFEKKFAAYIGVSDAVSISSGTAALSLILETLPLNRGDEVIVPAYTFPSVPSCIKAMGFLPRFVDINQRTDNPDTLKLKEIINHKTKAIIATHLFGRACNIDAIAELAKGKRIYVIEDCAHAIGSEYKGKKVGSLGDVAFFSFSLTKPFNTFNGGAIVSNDLDLLDKIRQKIKNIPNLPKSILLKNIFIAYLLHFLTKPAVFTFSIYPMLLLFSSIKKDLINIYNRMFKEHIFYGAKRFKFSNLQALTGIRNLQLFDKIITERSEKAKLFEELCNSRRISILQSKNDAACRNRFYYFYIIKHAQKDKIAKDLLRQGIDTGKQLMSNCGKLFSGPNTYTNTEEAYNNSLQLPLESCSRSKMLTIINTLKNNGNN